MGFVIVHPRLRFLCILGVMVCVMPRFASASLVLMGKNVTLSFSDVEAKFAPAVSESGVEGALYVAEPLDACNKLTPRSVNYSLNPFVLIIRGQCTFDEKVRNAQEAGYEAAIVYDNIDEDILVAMAGTAKDIHIYAVFVSRSSGDILKEYAGQQDAVIWILPSSENSVWSIMAISFTSLLAMSVVLASCFYFRRYRENSETSRPAGIRQSHGMSSQLVKAMPSLVFTSALEDNCTSSTCAICLEDYNVGEKLRILPCRHKFHVGCVDLWLTTWRTFCPVCKRDARAGAADPPPSESTPLLSVHSTRHSSSFHSQVSDSPPIEISWDSASLSFSRTYPFSSTPYTTLSHRSYGNSFPVSMSRSSDVRARFSRPYHASGLTSPHSLPVRLSRTLNSASYSHLVEISSRSHHMRNCIEPWPGQLGVMQSPDLSFHWSHGASNASLPSMSSPESQSHTLLWHCNESEASFSAAASAQSLPGC